MHRMSEVITEVSTGEQSMAEKEKAYKVITVNNHQEVFTHWEELGLKRCALVHIDAHPDLNDSIPIKDGSIDPKNMTIANFIVGAWYRDLISSMLWINPHSSHRKVQIMFDEESERPSAYPDSMRGRVPQIKIK